MGSWWKTGTFYLIHCLCPPRLTKLWLALDEAANQFQPRQIDKQSVGKLSGMQPQDDSKEQLLI